MKWRPHADPPPRFVDRVYAGLDMLRDYVLAGVWRADPRPTGSLEPLNAPAIFVVTSVVHPARPVIVYRRTRSVFDPAERLQQTHETIDSIRRYAPGAAIVLVENSLLGDAEWKKLASRVERAVRLDRDRRAVRLRDSFSRGAGEAYMTLAAQPILARSQYDLALKLGGRYRLDASFDLDRLPRNRVALRQIFDDPNRIMFSTRLYSVPPCWRASWEQSLRWAIPAGLRGTPLERAIVAKLPPGSWTQIDQIGVCGHMATTGHLIVE